MPRILSRWYGYKGEGEIEGFFLLGDLSSEPEIVRDVTCFKRVSRQGKDLM